MAAEIPRANLLMVLGDALGFMDTEESQMEWHLDKDRVNAFFCEAMAKRSVSFLFHFRARIKDETGFWILGDEGNVSFLFYCHVLVALEIRRDIARMWSKPLTWLQTRR